MKKAQLLKRDKDEPEVVDGEGIGRHHDHHWNVER